MEARRRGDLSEVSCVALPDLFRLNALVNDSMAAINMYIDAIVNISVV